jgi:hypothetical protein
VYCSAGQKEKIESVFMNRNLLFLEVLIVSSPLEKPTKPPFVWVYDGISVNKTLIGENLGEVSISSRIFINSNLSLNSLL